MSKAMSNTQKDPKTPSGHQILNFQPHFQPSNKLKYQINNILQYNRADNQHYDTRKFIQD